MNCDRKTVHQDEMSMNFVDFVVGPFFFSLAEAVPKAAFILQIMGDNRNQWHAMMESRVSAAEKASAPELDAEAAEKQAQARQESLAKWNTRKDTFDEKVVSAIANANARA